jgi:hypothetical protein
LQQVENGVEYLSQLIDSRMPFYIRRWQQRFNLLPFRITQVGWVGRSQLSCHSLSSLRGDHFLRFLLKGKRISFPKHAIGKTLNILVPFG